jgi:hypothetical protein
MARTPPPTVDQLRKEIDRGQTADKTPGVDPAAAPLGTDDEAGGRPPSPEQRAMEAEAQRREAPQRPTAGADATESLRAAESAAGDARLAGRRDNAARPSEGGSAGEDARASETVPSREDEAAGALSDDPDPPPSRPSSEP